MMVNIGLFKGWLASASQLNSCPKSPAAFQRLPADPGAGCFCKLGLLQATAAMLIELTISLQISKNVSRLTLYPSSKWKFSIGNVSVIKNLVAINFTVGE